MYQLNNVISRETVVEENKEKQAWMARINQEKLEGYLEFCGEFEQNDLNGFASHEAIAWLRIVLQDTDCQVPYPSLPGFIDRNGEYVKTEVDSKDSEVWFFFATHIMRVVKKVDGKFAEKFYIDLMNQANNDQYSIAAKLVKILGYSFGVYCVK